MDATYRRTRFFRVEVHKTQPSANCRLRWNVHFSLPGYLTMEFIKKSEKYDHLLGSGTSKKASGRK